MPQTANEKLLTSTIRHQLNLHSYSNQVVSDILSLLNAADKELTAKLAARLEAGRDNWTSRRMTALLSEIKATVADNYGAAFKALGKEMGELAGHEAEVAAKMIEKVRPVIPQSIKLNSDDGEITVNKLLSRIAKTKGTWKKDQLYTSVYGADRQTLLEAAILKLPKGNYTLTIEGRAAPSLVRQIESLYGVIAGTDIDERLIRGLAVKYPDTINANLTLGLQEIKIERNTPKKEISPETAAKVDAVFSITAPTAEQLAAIVATEPIQIGADGKLLLEEIFQQLAAGKEIRIRQAIRMGLAEGETVPQLVQRLVGTRAAKYTDGIIERDRRAAEAVVRTVVNHVSNRAAEMIYAKNTDLISGLQWCLTLDTRTCPVCVRNANAGKPYPMNNGPRPPVHVNDRCFMVPVLRSWKELGVDAEEFDAGSRASMDGVQAGDMQYGDWLRKYPDHAVEALGPTRAKMFLNGEIKVENFVNNKGKMLTLSELKAK